jgi:leucyl/phenylalanyl-tRNA--protein transferase
MTDEPLTPEMVLAGYRAGAFPMADPDDHIYWFSPDPRAIFEFDRLRMHRSLRQTIRRAVFEVRIDTAFDEVIAACADRPEGSWISPTIMSVYRTLHRWGYAHSVESWRDGQLTGGLYGVALGGAFFGESMFHRVTDASKVAFVALMHRLKARGFALVDTQWLTPHLAQLGAIEIPRCEYLARLRAAEPGTRVPGHAGPALAGGVLSGCLGVRRCRTSGALAASPTAEAVGHPIQILYVCRRISYNTRRWARPILRLAESAAYQSHDREGADQLCRRITAPSRSRLRADSAPVASASAARATGVPPGSAGSAACRNRGPLWPDRAPRRAWPGPPRFARRYRPCSGRRGRCPPRACA